MPVSEDWSRTALLVVSTRPLFLLDDLGQVLAHTLPHFTGGL